MAIAALALFVVAALMCDSKRPAAQFLGAILLVGLCVGTPTVLG